MLEKVTYASRDLAGVLAGVEHAYRIEMRIQGGETQYFTLKAKTRKEAVEEAYEVACIYATAKKETVLFRFPNGQWQFASGNVEMNYKQKTTLRERFKKLANAFFDFEEEE